MLFDSHCHLTDDRFDGDAEAVIGRARDEGVDGIVTIGIDPDDAERARALAERAEGGVWSTAGIHPHAARDADTAALGRIADLARDDRVVAVGETGLDYHYDHSTRRAQRTSFERHVEIAVERDLPVVVHSRDADEDTAAMVREAGAEGARGVLHCFAGGATLLDAGLEAGWWISFSGIVTFRGYEDDDLVRAVPAERLLVETDSPYLAPVPKRGKRNEPAFVRHVAEAVARMRGVPFEEVARTTSRNARALYGLDHAAGR